jgi:hypothetical protein
MCLSTNGNLHVLMITSFDLYISSTQLSSDDGYLSHGIETAMLPGTNRHSTVTSATQIWSDDSGLINMA